MSKEENKSNNEKSVTKSDYKNMPWILIGGVFAAVLLATSISFLLFNDNPRHNSKNWTPMSSMRGFNGDDGMMMGDNRRGGKMSRRGSETVTAISTSSITVKYNDGATKTYAIDKNTRVLKTDRTYGIIDDIKNDSKVMVRSLDPTAEKPVASDIVLR